MQEFYINKNSTLPLLKMELINNGKYDFDKFYEFIQRAVITFTMINSETESIKIANNPAIILPKETDCSEEYFIAYQWKPRDTKTKGKYYGSFTIILDDSDGGGNLIVPIEEKLIINIQ
jgi:hypothetical protein